MNQKLRLGSILDLCPFGTTFTLEGSQTTTAGLNAKPSKESDAWVKGNKAIDYKITPQTEDDEITAFDRDTKTYASDKNTTVKGYTIEITSSEMNALCMAIIYGCETLKGGESVQPFTSGEFGKKVWARISKYDQNKQEALILEVAAVLKVEVPQENNKLLQPKITLEVLQSPLNTLTPTAVIAPTA